jgi:hypothetical protein
MTVRMTSSFLLIADYIIRIEDWNNRVLEYWEKWSGRADRAGKATERPGERESSSKKLVTELTWTNPLKNISGYFAE